jgi:5-formyltetrahydrofolate cyclo-ligase
VSGTNPQPRVAKTDLDVIAWRTAERKRLLEIRATLALEQRRVLDERMTALLLATFRVPPGAIVGFYWPMKGEFDPRIAVLRWREAGARAALPVVVGKAAPLSFREWWPGVDTDPGVFNLPVPRDTPTLVPDLVLMPPVGFDAAGYRLGYGGGYFDRTLASITPQPLKIGVGREAGRIATIHPQPHDIAMDFVVTEAGLHAVRSSRLERIVEPGYTVNVAPRAPAHRSDSSRR